MTIKNFFSRFQKKSVGRAVLVGSSMQRASGMSRDLDTFFREGYQKNAVAFRCVKLIADAASTIPIRLKAQKGTEIVDVDSHPILDLIYKPNPFQTYSSLVKEFFSFYALAGNSFMEAVFPTLETDLSVPNKLQPTELWTLPPGRISVEKNRQGRPGAYVIKNLGSEVVFPIDILGRSRLLHMHTYNPLDMYWGMSPLDPAAYDIDAHNEAKQWNFSLLKNSASPSGVIQVELSDDNRSGSLTTEQRQMLRRDIDDLFSGPRNAGRPIILEGGAKWIATGLSPREMDFNAGKNVTARDIALAFGVPEQLVGIPEAQKYDNNELAKVALYTDTVIPIFQDWVDYLNMWLVPLWLDEGLYLQVDEENIKALEGVRRNKWAAVESMASLTVNEKRNLCGFGQYEPGQTAADTLWINAGQIPIEQAFMLDDPTDQTTEEEDTSDYTSDNEDDDQEGDNGKGTKPDEAKARTWKRLRTIKVKCERALMNHVSAAFKSEADQLEKALNTIADPRMHMIEFVVNEIIDKSTIKLTKTMAATLSEYMVQAAQPILDLPKGQPGYEQKTPDPMWKFNSFLKDYVEVQVGRKIKTISGNTKKRVLKALRQVMSEDITGGVGVPALIAAMRKTYEPMTKGRARVIARTETHLATETAQYQAAKATGAEMVKEWVPAAYIEGRSRDEHYDMKGVRVGIEEKFEVKNPNGGYDEMNTPGDPTAPPEQVCNCRCVCAYDLR